MTFDENNQNHHYLKSDGYFECDLFKIEKISDSTKIIINDFGIIQDEHGIVLHEENNIFDNIFYCNRFDPFQK